MLPLTSPAEAVFQTYAPQVYNLARRLPGNDSDAEGVTRYLQLLVVGKLDTFRGKAGRGAWPHRITVSAVLMRRWGRSIQRRQAVGSVWEIGKGFVADRQLFRA
jgi:DNA-directed RNA polymerase specialized sigma24 family protein